MGKGRTGLGLVGLAYPVQPALIHRLRVLLELVLLPLDMGTLDVSRQVRHIGDPGYRPLRGWHCGVQCGWRLRMLGQGKVGASKRKVGEGRVHLE